MKRLARKPWAPLIMVSLVAMLLSVLAAGWANERKDRLEQVEALERHVINNRAAYRATVYGLTYALNAEQATAGYYESQWHQCRSE